MIIDATVFFDLLKLVVHRNDERIKRLADALFELYSENVNNISSTDLRYCELYISLIKEIISNQINYTDNKIDIINIFKRQLMSQSFKRDAYIKDALKSIVDNDINPTRLADITKRLNNIVAWYTSKKYINKMYGQLRESELSYSIDDQAESLDLVKTLVDEFKSSIMEVNSVTNRGGPVEVIDMTNKNSIREAYKLFKERRVDHVLKTGLQGLNKMFGPDGGMGLGESILFAARTHNFKSGILMKMPQWIVKYSNPPRIPGKKPMILVISLENEGYQNMLKMFKEMYIALKGELPPPDMSEDQIVDSIYDFFNQSEYTLVIERYLPSNFGYNELVSLVEKYESAGFKIVATVIDYISQMKTHSSGSTSSAGGHVLLQELYNHIANFFKAIGTTVISATQLNRGASDIAASGIPHPVKHYSERHFAGSTGIAREVDFIAFMEIEKDEEGNSWLTMNWGKHRYVDDTVEKDKFVAYKFEGAKGICDDIGGPFMGVRNIYKKNNKNKQATPDDIEAILGGI